MIIIQSENISNWW